MVSWYEITRPATLRSVELGDDHRAVGPGATRAGRARLGVDASGATAAVDVPGRAVAARRGRLGVAGERAATAEPGRGPDASERTGRSPSASGDVDVADRGCAASAAVRDRGGCRADVRDTATARSAVPPHRRVACP